jgi:serine/threonine protein phosphatase PrpC
MEAPATYEWACGTLAVFTAPAPGKTGDNEDAIAVAAVDDDTAVLVLADGAGGHGNGGPAARVAVEAVVRELTSLDSTPIRGAILNGFEAANTAITEQLPGAATTLAVAEISDHRIRTYHAGDSGVCVIGGRGRIKLQTVFHSPTGYAVEAGMLNEEDALAHDERHLVSNLVGTGQMSVEIGSHMSLAPRDTVVLASDGLFDNLYIDEISACVRKNDLDQACRRLIEATLSRMTETTPERPSKPDDLTVVLYRRRK